MSYDFTKKQITGASSAFLADQALAKSTDLPYSIRKFSAETNENFDEQLNLSKLIQYNSKKYGVQYNESMVNAQLELDGYSSSQEAIDDSLKKYNLIGALNPLEYFGEGGRDMPTFSNARILAKATAQQGLLSAKRAIAIGDLIAAKDMENGLIDAEQAEGKAENAKTVKGAFYISSGINRGTSSTDAQNRISDSVDRLDKYKEEQKEINDAIESVPIEQRMSLGGIMATVSGEIPSMALYLIPGVGTTAGYTYNLLRYYDEAYFEYFDKYTREGMNVEEAEQRASASASGYAAMFSIVATVVDKAQVGVGTKGVQSFQRTGIKGFADNQLFILKQAQPSAIGELLQEMSETAYLQQQTKGEINWSSVIDSGIYGYFGGLLGGEVFGQINVVQKGKARKKLIKDGVSPNVASKIVNAKNNDEALKIFKEEYLDKEMRDVGNEMEKEVIEKESVRITDTFVTRGEVTRINKTKTEEEINEIVVNKKGIEDDEVAQDLLRSAINNPTDENVNKYNSYLVKKRRAIIDQNIGDDEEEEVVEQTEQEQLIEEEVREINVEEEVDNIRKKYIQKRDTTNLRIEEEFGKPIESLRGKKRRQANEQKKKDNRETNEEEQQEIKEYFDDRKRTVNFDIATNPDGTINVKRTTERLQRALRREQLDKKRETPDPLSNIYNTADTPINIVEETENELQENEDESEEVQDTVKARSRILNRSVKLDKGLVPILSRIRDISPQLFRRLTRFEFNVHNKKAKYIKRLEGFLDEFITLQKTNPTVAKEVDLALKNGDFETVLKHISKENVDNLRSVLKDLRDSLVNSGYNVADRENYFPNRVNDYEGLTNFFGKDLGSSIDRAWKQAENKLREKDPNRRLTEQEKAKIANQVIVGQFKFAGGKTPKSTRERVIKDITEEMNEFYFNPIEALMIHIDEIVDTTEARSLFGQDLDSEAEIQEVAESIGSIVRKIKEENNLSNQDERVLIDTLYARFTAQPSSRVTSIFKGLTYASMLSDFESTITQMSELAFNMVRNGYANAINSLSSEKQLKLQDIGLEQINQELNEKGAAGIINKILTATGFKRLDKFNKESFIEGARQNVKQQLENNKLDKFNEERFNVLFPNKKEREQVKQDFLNENMTEDVAFFLFSSLLDVQPITLSNMPQKYLEMPNGRMFYTLKTFTIMQLDLFRRQGLDDLVNGMVTGDKQLATQGFGKLAEIAILFTAMGMGTDALKDLLRGKTINLTDSFLDNMFKLVGLYRFGVEENLKLGKPSDIVFEAIQPPIAFFDSAAKDISTIIRKSDFSKDDWFQNLEFADFTLVREIPIIGDRLYYMFGKGRINELKEQKKIEEERQREMRGEPKEEEVKQREIDLGIRASDAEKENVKREELRKDFGGLPERIRENILGID